MQVYVEREGRKRKIAFNGTVSQLLPVLNVNPETVLVVRNSELLSPEDVISDSDEIKILSVISGG